MGQCQIGINRVFQSIVQDNGQFLFIHWKNIRQRDLGIHKDPLICGLVKVGGKHSVQYQWAAPSDFLLFVQPLLGGV